MAAPTSIFRSPSHFPSIIKPKQPLNIINTHNSHLQPLTSPVCLSLSREPVQFRRSRSTIPEKFTRIWRNNATSGELMPSETTTMDTSEQIMSATNDEGTSVIISVLLTIAFVALSILTIGVIYIGVTDFLQKREREKFEKEEAAKKKKKKSGKKVKARARAGPRGFGQKINEEEDD